MGSGTEFGDPQTVQDLSAAARRTVADLRQLIELMNRDVKATVPDRWGGAGATAFQQFWANLARAVAGLGSPLETYGKALEIAAETMANARRQFEAAQQFANANGLMIGQDLVVQAVDPSRPGIQAVVNQGQEMVEQARRLATTAQEQIKRANEVLDQEAESAVRQLLEIQNALNGGAGRRRGPRQRPTGPGIYGPEGRIRVPRPGAGTWMGGPRDGRWYPDRPQEFGIRLNRPEYIRWREGVPDLRDHGVPAQEIKGLNPHVSGLRLTGDSYADPRQADAVMGRSFGFRDQPGLTAADQFRMWRSEPGRDYVWHHYSDHEMTLVDGRLHRSVAHDGPFVRR
jgi:uncharacterized protein YukE